MPGRIPFGFYGEFDPLVIPESSRCLQNEFFCFQGYAGLIPQDKGDGGYGDPAFSGNIG
jgi:hypothetical protein